ncbi:hemerythrin domain-containing protein [Nocardioides aurantiacus]|uniref:hemerythrin domain-containing protein n=1 Tax=Nocardioides aurantiacus TaxID=86796 RepID=UPI00403FBA5A
MCEYCGCRGNPPIAELMDEHTALVDQAHLVRRELGAGNRVAALARLTDLLAHLDRHVEREEDGIFRAIRATGDFVEEIDDLEGEHRGFADAVAGLDLEAEGFTDRVTRLLDDLDAHVEREDLGIFPVSVVTLGATGWAMVDEAHTRSPSFLLDPTTSPEEGTCTTSH